MTWPIPTRTRWQFPIITDGELYFRLTGVAPLMTSAAWSTANLAVYVPIWLEHPIKMAKLYVFHGATASGNLDVGVYAPDANGAPGTKITSTGSVAQSGTSAWTAQTLAAGLPAGLVYLAMAMNNTTGTVTRLVALTTNGKGPKVANIYTEAAAFPLPATATPSRAGVAVNVPMLGVSTL